MRRAAYLLLLCVVAPSWCRVVVPGKRGKSDGETAPRFKATSSMQPVLKLRKRLGALGSALTLGCDYNLQDRTASFDASWRDSVMGGELSLKNLNRVELRKAWLFPGVRPGRARTGESARRHPWPAVLTPCGRGPQASSTPPPSWSC